MTRAALPVIVLACSVACSWQTASNRQIVYVVDTSGSVTADARDAAIRSIQGGLQSLERGDKVAIVPITGDLHGGTLGRVLRFELSSRREPYDADRRRLVRNVDKQLSAFMVSVPPSAHTDLLSTFNFAAEELDQALVRMLVCLTDFIQDDRQFDFTTDRRLTSEHSAKEFAQQLAGRFPQ